MTWPSATLQFVGYRFTAPIRGDQNTYIVKFDHRLDSNGKHQVFLRETPERQLERNAAVLDFRPTRSI
jgi:hypothetical protein